MHPSLHLVRIVSRVSNGALSFTSIQHAVGYRLGKPLKQCLGDRNVYHLLLDRGRQQHSSVQLTSDDELLEPLASLIRAHAHEPSRKHDGDTSWTSISAVSTCISDVGQITGLRYGTSRILFTRCARSRRLGFAGMTNHYPPCQPKTNVLNGLHGIQPACNPSRSP